MKTPAQLRETLEQKPQRAFPTGFASLDEVTAGGLRAGDLSVVGAITGQGKTAFVEQVALDVSLDHDVLFLPLELGEDETLVRMGAKLDRTATTAFRTDGLDPLTEEKFKQRRLRIFEPKFDRPADVDGIAKLIEREKCPIVIIDHVRHIDGWLVDGAKSTHIGPTKIVQKLKAVAKRLDVHIMLCQQLNRDRFGKRPSMAQLQDTSALAQLASLVVLLHHPFHGQGSFDDIAEMLVEKNRTGPTCMIHYRWVGETMSLYELTPAEQISARCCRKRERVAAEVSK